MVQEKQSVWSQKIPIKEQIEVTQRISKYTRPYLKQFLMAIVFSIISIGITVVLPRLVQLYIDRYLKTSNVTLRIALMFAVIYLVLLVLQSLFNYLTTYIFNMASERTVQNIRTIIFTKVNQLGMRYFDQTPAGSIVTRVTNDTETLKNFWLTFFSVFEGIVTIISVFIGMYLLNPQMALYFLPFIPIMFLIIWYYQSYSSRVYRSMREIVSRLNSKINETILGMNIIQVFRQEHRMMEEFDRMNDQHFASRKEMIRMNALLLMSLIGFLESLALALVIYILGGQFFDGLVEVGMIYAFTQYCIQFFRPMGMMMDSLSMLQEGVVSSYRILRVLDHQEEVPHQQVDPAHPATITNAHIVFNHLTFSYDGEQNVLDDVSFEVPPGETVAIVGHTGSGKSSIINVLMRFYEFQSGDVLIDGQSIRNFSYDTLRQEVGLVLQDSFLFYGDVSRNIRLLDQTITDREVEEAAEFVNADQFINKYSEGYQRRVIERGASYSSGEKQLISFARTMVRQPKILILDEATANIDTETEEYIQESLSKMRKNRTTIAIAHRLSTIKDADNIIVLDQGKIIEQGTHDQLIAQKGTYYQMYQLQTMN